MKNDFIFIIFLEILDYFLTDWDFSVKLNCKLICFISAVGFALGSFKKNVKIDKVSFLFRNQRFDWGGEK